MAGGTENKRQLLRPDPVWLVAVVIVGLAILVYWPVADYDFINYDDPSYVVENPMVPRGLSLEGFMWAFTTFHDANWFPLTWLSYMLDVELFGVRPGGHHLVNLALHAAAAAVLFLVLKAMTGTLWPSALAACFFTVHPLHVESVAWISERKDVLSGLFWMLTMATYIGYLRWPGRGRYLITVFVFALGLMVKPMLVTLPFVLLLLDYWPLGRWLPGRGGGIPWRLVYDKAPLFALTAASSAVTFVAQKSAGAVSTVDLIPVKVRVANALSAYWWYVQKMFWPVKLAVFYPHPLRTPPIWRTAGAAAFLLGVTGLVVFRGRRRPYLPVGWFWFLGTLVPVIGLIQVGSQAAADRYTYLPLTGLFLALLWGARDLAARGEALRKIMPLFSLAVVFLAAGAGAQVRHWRNDFTLYSHAVEVTKFNWLAHHGLGDHYLKQGQYDNAIIHLKIAMSYRPRYAEAYNNLGVVYQKQGRYRESLETFKKSIELKGSYAVSYFNAGDTLNTLGQQREAVSYFLKAISLNPRYAEAHNGLGVSYLGLGRYPEAMRELGEAIRLKPGLFEALNNLGTARYQLGRYQEAIETYRQAARLKPEHPEVYYNLGMAYDTVGRYRDSVEAYGNAAKLRPGYADALYRLGAAYVNLGERAAASSVRKSLMTVDPAAADELGKLIAPFPASESSGFP